MKKSFSSIKNKLISRYTMEDEDSNKTKSTNVNVLLNRVKLDKKREKIKKLIFSAIASTGVIVFGILVF